MLKKCEHLRGGVDNKVWLCYNLKLDNRFLSMSIGAHLKGEDSLTPFFDLHSHMLCCVDDGASNPTEMYEMLEASYNDGARAICLTPHFSPYLYGDTFEASQEAFALLKEYASRTHPDLSLFLGHELGYYGGCLDALHSGRCRSLAGSRYVLIDFPERAEFFEIDNAVDLLLRDGYVPVLAHTERYVALQKRLPWIDFFIDNGGVVQINASSAVGDWGPDIQKQWVTLVQKGLVHVISSDAHDLSVRPPLMSVCVGLLEKYCDEETVRALVWDNAWKIVQDTPI